MGNSFGISVKQSRQETGIGVFAFAIVLFFAIGGSGVNAGAIDNNSGLLRPVVKTSKAKLHARVIRIAQSDEAVFRVNQLEDQIRLLNGQIEDMNFQLLQIQEQMRKMQEDNEFRFQELEEKRRGQLGNQKKKLAGKRQGKAINLGKLQPSKSAKKFGNLDGNNKLVKTTKKPRMIDGVELYDGTQEEESVDGPQIPLGTITFDSLGNVVDSALGKPLDLTARLPSLNDADTNNSGLQVKSNLETVGTPRELYEMGYEYFQAGDYANSQRIFAAFVERYPDNEKIANAQFWLGESMFSQANFKDAAKVFLDAHTNWPQARIAPQTLLKLGLSLAGMRQRELACATYAKVFKKYPNIGNALKRRVVDEQNSSHCLNG